MTCQQGFSLVMAMFILVVTALLGSYMVRLTGVQQTTSTYALQGARAYQAARAGLEWAIARLSNGGSCTDVNAQTALTFQDITGFTVSLTCTANTYSEGNGNPTIYLITALSQFGSYTSTHYTARRIEVSVVLNN